MAKLPINQAQGNLNSRVLIASSPNKRVLKGKQLRDNTFSVVGFTQGEFAINGSNEFESLFSTRDTQSLQQIQFGIEQLKNNLPSSINVLGRKIPLGKGSENASQFVSKIVNTMRSTSLTTQRWLGSTVPSFSVDLTFVALKEDDDVTQPVLNLHRTVYPGEASENQAVTPLIDLGPDNKFMVPPLGYDHATGAGTISVQIGTWFQAKGMLMEDVSFNYSKETISNGKPLYAQGSIAFKPTRMITINDLIDYFRLETL